MPSCKHTIDSILSSHYLFTNLQVIHIISLLIYHLMYSKASHIYIYHPVNIYHDTCIPSCQYTIVYLYIYIHTILFTPICKKSIYLPTCKSHISQIVNVWNPWVGSPKKTPKSLKNTLYSPHFTTFFMTCGGLFRGANPSGKLAQITCWSPQSSHSLLVIPLLSVPFRMIPQIHMMIHIDGLRWLAFGYVLNRCGLISDHPQPQPAPWLPGLTRHASKGHKADQHWWRGGFEKEEGWTSTCPSSWCHQTPTHGYLRYMDDPLIETNHHLDWAKNLFVSMSFSWCPRNENLVKDNLCMDEFLTQKLTDQARNHMFTSNT